MEYQTFKGYFMPKQYILLFCIYYNLSNRLIGPVGRVGRVILKTFKMALETSLLNTQQYKVRIKGKVEQSRERSSALLYTSV